MNLKSAPAQFKATGDSTSGEFEALVSVFGNIDSYREVVRKGAFADTIAAWTASGDTLPVLWSHNMSDPEGNIGAVLEMAELEPGDARIPDWVDPHVKSHGGLWVRGKIDTGSEASRIAVQGLRLMKSRRVTQFSYAYDEVDSGPATYDGQDVWELRAVRLHEVSPCQVGANQLTELLGAKQQLRRTSTNTHASAAIREAASQLLAALNDDERADTSDAAKSGGEPATANAQDETPALLDRASLAVLLNLARAKCAHSVAN